MPNQGEYVRETTLHTQRRRCSRHQSKGDPVAHGEDHGEAVMEITGGADIHLQPVDKPTLEQVDAPE